MTQMCMTSGPCDGTSPVCDECLVEAKRFDSLGDQGYADVLLAKGATQGDLEDVKRALDLGASPNTRVGLSMKMGEAMHQKGSSPQLVCPLMRACAGGHKDIVECLLDAGAKPNLCDSRGWTALCYALGSGELAVARFLLEHLDEADAAVAKGSFLARREEVIVCCEEEADTLAVEELLKELEPPGFLALPEGEMVAAPPPQRP